MYVDHVHLFASNYQLLVIIKFSNITFLRKGIHRYTPLTNQKGRGSSPSSSVILKVQNVD